MTLIGIVLGGAFFSVFLFLFYWKQSHGMKQTHKRVKTWFGKEDDEDRNSFILLIGDKFDNSELSRNLEQKLIQANIGLKPSEYTGIYILILITLTYINHFFLGLVFPVDLAFSYFVVWFVSKVFLNSRKDKLTESFNKQLPEVCRMLGNAMKAGKTIPQGVSMVGEELSSPAGPEFKRMDQQLKLGDDLEDVFNDLRPRIAGNDIKIFTSTILIQHRVGGNLAQVMTLMAETMEERARVHKEVQTVTAESRSIAYILAIMPLLMAGMMNLFIPGFLNPLMTPLGLILFVVFLALLLGGFFIIKRITKIRV